MTIRTNRRESYCWDDLVAAPAFKVGDLVYAPNYIDAMRPRHRALALTPGLIIGTEPYAECGPNPRQSVCTYVVLWPNTRRKLLAIDLKTWGE